MINGNWVINIQSNVYIWRSAIALGATINFSVVLRCILLGIVVWSLWIVRGGCIIFYASGTVSCWVW